MHRCAAVGCTATIRRGLLMCGFHWHMVPRPLQLAVHRTWRSFLRHEGIQWRRAYDAATKAAIDAVYSRQSGMKKEP